MHENVILMHVLFVAVQANKIYSYNSHMFTMDSNLHDVIRQNRKVLNRKHALVVDLCYAYLIWTCIPNQGTLLFSYGRWCCSRCLLFCSHDRD